MSLLKKELRKTMKTVLESVKEEEIGRQSRLLVEKILKSPIFLESQRVSLFISTTGEICTDDLVRGCFQLGKQIFVPQFAKGNPIMRMVSLPSIESFENLSTTLWNIRQPSLDQQQEDYFVSGPLDLVLVPGVAFTKEGHRLGHGMGYYDRWFAEHNNKFGKRPYAIGLALEQQIVATVPMTETDVVLDDVLIP